MMKLVTSLMICLMLPVIGMAEPFERKALTEMQPPAIRTVVEAGKYKHLSNSSWPPTPAIFRLVTVETSSNQSDIHGAVSIGEWVRAESLNSEAAFVIADLIYYPRFDTGWDTSLGLRFAGGMAWLDQTTSRLSTRYQFHLALHVVFNFGLVDIRWGCHHFSNGNKIHGYRRSEPNHAEEFCGTAIGARF